MKQNSEQPEQDEQPAEIVTLDKPQQRRKAYLGTWWVTVAAGVIVLVLIVCGFIYGCNNLGNFRQYGYIGAFFIAILAGSTIIVPIPGTPVVFALGGMSREITNPIFIGLAAGLGEAIGELTGYMVGWGSHNALQSRQIRLYSRIEGWVRKRGSLVIFFASSVFNPLFDMFGAAAGAIRFPLWKFFLLCWGGKTIKNTGVAFLGWWGLGFILEWLGITL